MDYLLNGLPYFPGTTIFGTGLFSDGTAAAPSISFAADSDTGFYRAGANEIGFTANGTRSFTFSTDGVLKGVQGANYLEMNGTGRINLVAAGTNQNITLTPSGTGVVQSGDGTSVGQVTNRTSVSGAGVAALSLIRLGAEDLQLRNSAGNLSFWRDTAEFARFNASNRFLLGTATDSGALLQVGANAATGYATAGMSFGGDTFLSRENAGTLRLSGGNPVMALMPTTATQAGFFTVVNSGGTTYIGCDNSTGGNFGAGAYTAIFGSGSAATAIVSLGVKAVVFDTSQNAVFAATVAMGQYTTAGAPAYAKGRIYFDVTLNKLRVGGATTWETITSA